MWTLRQLGWELDKATSVVNFCGHALAYVPRAESADYFSLVPVMDERD